MNIEYGKPHIHALSSYEPRASCANSSHHEANENPLGPSPRAIAAICEAASFVHRYPDANSSALRSALAEKLDIDSACIALTNGSDEMIALLCQALVGKGNTAILSEGTFVTFAVRARAAEARLVMVPLQRPSHRHDLRAMAEAITADTRLVFVCNPNNPTGTSNSAEELAEFLRRVPKSVTVVVDEAYGEFAAAEASFPNLVLELKRGRSNLIVLRTFAKAHGLAGLRIGYAMGDAALLAYIQKLRPIFSVNMLAQAAALAALSDESHLRASIHYAHEWRAKFTDRLTGSGFTVIPSQANFVMVHVGDDAAAADYLNARGFAVTPLSAWGLPGYLRLSFAAPRENERLIASLLGWRS